MGLEKEVEEHKMLYNQIDKKDNKKRTTSIRRDTGKIRLVERRPEKNKIRQDNTLCCQSWWAGRRVG